MKDYSFKKFFLIIPSFIILSSILVYLFIINYNSEISFDQNQNTEKINNLEITVFIPSSSKPTLNNYNPQYLFYIGEWIYVYQEYYNVTIQNNSYNTYLSINITKDNITYYNQDVYNTKIENARFWYFSTNYEEWSEGRYIVTCYLLDNITKKEISATTYFDLILNPEN